jgi:hypothetical protein
VGVQGNRKELQMNFSMRISTLAVLLIITTSISATAGTYFIGRDEGGVYFQTDRHGGWYIDIEDLMYFQPGQKGQYAKGRDAKGTFIKTESNHKFYLDIDARQAQINEIQSYNRENSDLLDTKQTRVLIKGNQVLVPVQIGYGQRKTEARLLLDTGASITTLHRDIAKKLTIYKTRKAKLMVPGGSTVIVDFVKLEFIKSGPYRLSSPTVAIIDHSGPAVSYQGLLGMDFLRGRQYRIDFKNEVIIWSD